MDYFLLFVCCNLHRFPIQWLAKCQYRIITTFSSHVWYKWHRQVNRIIITGWLLNHWITMYYCITSTRTIMWCFHKTIPQGFHTCNKSRILQQIVKNFCVLPRGTLQWISLNIFSGLISQENLKKFVLTLSRLGLLRVVLLGGESVWSPFLFQKELIKYQYNNNSILI